MKIENQNLNKALIAEAQNARKADASRRTDRMGETQSVGQEDADVSFSSDAQAMAKAHELASAAPDVREDKIAALKARIESGEYGVSAEEIADRMVDDHLESLGIL